MKNENKWIVVILGISMALQGCVKIEPCTQMPAKPIITNGPLLTVNVGNSFSPDISNDNNLVGLLYYWIAPDGEVIQESASPSLDLYTDNYVFPGTYKLVQSNTPGSCHSDTATIDLKINYNPPTCSTANNSFVGNSNSSYTFGQGICNTYGANYRAVWTNGNLAFEIEMGYKVTNYPYRFGINSYWDIQNNNARLIFKNGSESFVAEGGQLYVHEVSPGVLQVKFCDISFKDDLGYTEFYSAKGQLQFIYQ